MIKLKKGGIIFIKHTRDPKIETNGAIHDRNYKYCT